MKVGRLWNTQELNIFNRLKTPYLIQEFLDGLEYSADNSYRSPRRVIQDRLAHCTDGALFAAAALRQLGYPPVIMELQAVRDDDHLLALFRERGRYGAVAKSNFVTLRYREPVYKSVRELVMSYFEGFYNVEGEKTLRTYSVPMHLTRFDHLEWMTREDGIQIIMERLESSRHYPVATPAMIAALHKLDQRSYHAGLIGSKAEGLYKVKNEK